MITTDQLNKLNREVKQWSQQSRNLLEERVRLLTNKNKHIFLFARLKGYGRGQTSKFRSDKLADSITNKTLQDLGMVNRIIFPFAKHGYFIAVGASRGHSAKSNPRRKIEWYNFIFEKEIEQLADIYAENLADAQIKQHILDFNTKV